MKRPQAIPLITHDPYFSAWSPSDKLYESNTMHWCGKPYIMTGHIIIDGKPFRFMGNGQGDTLVQTGLLITPTSSCFEFQGGGVQLNVCFISPILITDLELVSRPCTYVDVCVSSIDNKNHDIKIIFDADESLCHDAAEDRPMLGGVHKLQYGNCAWMGLRKQTPLGQSGDGIKIDWGYMYIYAYKGDTGYSTDINAWRKDKTGLDIRNNNTVGIYAAITFENVNSVQKAYIALAYDDLQAINYFGYSLKAYWARHGETAIEMIEKAIKQHDSILARCEVFDKKLMDDARAIGGDEYAFLCSLAYRQSIAAHKLVEDEYSYPAFLSKENFSNGCIGTVDVSYPSTPLYLLYNPELVMGMIRPVIRFAKLPVWTFDFAPHDVGRYPHAIGQVYALKDYQGVDYSDVFPPYYSFPANAGIYDTRHQMPVEECGNMLVMIAAVLQQDNGFTHEFIEDMPLLEQWAAYLIKHGDDPGEQLCTDDFAGHLAHNVNLSAKAIMGVAAMGLIKQAAGNTIEAEAYIEKARNMAKTWEDKFKGMEYTPLTFDKPDTWGLKYNIVWDLVFNLGLFEKETYLREVKTYLSKQNEYGCPLDSRKDYTKSDWVLWCASFADDYNDRFALINPVYKYVNNSTCRVPFSDWYCTKNANTHNFRNRSVQGGIFMPMLVAKKSVNW